VAFSLFGSAVGEDTAVKREASDEHLVAEWTEIISRWNEVYGTNSPATKSDLI